MNKKREDLEAIVDLLHGWCVEYGEPYVTMHVSISNDHACGCADIGVERPDYWNLTVYQKYETSVAETVEKAGSGGDSIDCPEAS